MNIVIALFTILGATALIFVVILKEIYRINRGAQKNWDMALQNSQRISILERAQTLMNDPTLLKKHEEPKLSQQEKGGLVNERVDRNKSRKQMQEQPK